MVLGLEFAAQDVADQKQVSNKFLVQFFEAKFRSVFNLCLI